jgi:hypothetical protein
MLCINYGCKCWLCVCLVAFHIPKGFHVYVPNTRFFFDLTALSRFIPEKPPVAPLPKNFPIFYTTPNVHYRVRKSPPLAPVLSQMNPVHRTQFCFSEMQSNVILPPGLFHYGFPHPIYIPLLPSCYMPCLSVLPDFVLIIYGKEKLWNSSFCNFLQPLTISWRFGPHITQSTLFPHYLVPISKLVQNYMKF